MKRLFKILPVLAILAAFGIGGVSSAMAGNCTTYTSPITDPSDDGGVRFTAQIYGCSGVSQVQFMTVLHTNNGYISDLTTGLNHESYSSWGNGVQSSPCANAGSGVCSLVYLHAVWCVGPARQLQAIFPFRIQSIDIHGVRTWGPVHYAAGWVGSSRCD